MSAVLEAREPSARYLEAVQPALVRQFGLLATAPGAVVRLRKLILTLAVQGKVVQQDPGDVPAGELLRRIRNERTALIAAGLIKQDKPAAPISSEEEPCPLPRGWAWVRFGDLIHELCTGPFGSLIYKKDYVSGGVPLINPSHMIHGRIEHDPDVSVSALMASQLAAYRLSAGDVLLARRGEMGRYALVTEREAGWLCGTGSFFLKLFKAYDRRFFGLTLEDPRLRQHLLGESVGATMTNLNQRILLDAVVAVAPLAEQARIVARVDELMRLCDALEAQGRLEAEQHARLLGTLLGTLTDSTTPEELAANWQRVADHFDLLLDRPEAVDALEQTILQLAVRGLLVPQDPSDEPATALIQKILAVKEHLVLTGRRKRERALHPNVDGAKPFDLREGWTWVRLQEVCDVRDGTHDTPKYHDTGVPLVTSKNLSSGRLDLTDVKLISAADHTAISARSKVDHDDILFAMIGSIGNPVLVDTDIEFSIKNVALFKQYDRALSDPRYLLLSLTVAAGEMKAKAAGGVQAFVSLGQIRNTTMAIPPLAEQGRIVNRVTELRRLCADLRQRVTASQTTQSHLANALVDLAVA